VNPVARSEPSLAPLTFSIVTPSLNQGAFLEECILSVKDQLEADSEHIVVDGSSSDETVAVLKRHSHLKWISEPDSGQADALNKAIRMSSGEIIGWLNADDAYLPHTLETVRRFFAKHPDVAMAYGYVYVTDARSRRIRKRYSPDFDFGLLVRNGDCYAQPTFFFRRSVIDEIGYFDPTQRWTMDYEFILRVGQRFRVAKIPRCLGTFRMHSGSMSHTGGPLSRRMKETSLEIQARYSRFLKPRYPAIMYRIHDAMILSWFKLLGRVASMPIYLRYRISTFGRGA